jgi:hypothetical protein
LITKELLGRELIDDLYFQDLFLDFEGDHTSKRYWDWMLRRSTELQILQNKQEILNEL